MIKNFKTLLKINTHKNYELIIIIVTIFFLVDKIIDENHHTVQLLYNTMSMKHEHGNIYNDNLLYAFEKMIKSKIYNTDDKEKINQIYININNTLKNQNISFSLPIIYV